MTNYQQRINDALFARQAPEVQKTIKEILGQLKSIEQCLYWAIDPDDPVEMWPGSLIEHAHALVDLGHEYRAALKVNPPPKYEDEDEEDVA